MNKALIVDASDSDRRLMSGLLIKSDMSRLQSRLLRQQRTRWRYRLGALSEA